MKLIKMRVLFFTLFILLNDISFSQTLVPYRNKNGTYKFVDSSSMYDLKLGEFRHILTFFNKQDLAIVNIGKDGQAGFSDIVINKRGRDVFWFNNSSGLDLMSSIDALHNKSGDDFLITIHEIRQSYTKRKPYGCYFLSKNYKSPELDGIRYFNENKLAFLERRETNTGSKDFWGFYKITGELIVEPIYDNVREFNEGLAAVCSPLGWGFIDSTGSEVIKTKYLEVRSFHEGRALVLSKNNELFFIDKTGKQIFKLPGNHWNLPNSDLVSDFKYERILYNYNSYNGSTQLINKNGSITSLKLPQNLFYSTGGNNIGHLFLGTHFYCRKQYQSTASIYDLNGKVIIPFGKYNILEPPNEGLLPFEINGAWGFVNLKGEEVIPAKYYEVKKFQNGLAMVKSIRGWQFINKEGTIVFSHKDHPLDKQNSYEFLKNGFIRFSCKDCFFSEVFIDLKGRRFYEE